MKPILTLTAIAISMGSSASCKQAETPQNRYQVVFKAEDDRGVPLPGLPIRVGETLLGETSPGGTLIVQVAAKEGERYPLQAPCPEDHNADDPPVDVFFRSTKGLGGDVQNHIELTIVCARTRRLAALLIHADGYEDMPISIDGVVRGRTGAEGFAHLRLDRQPGVQFQVSLDSSSHPTLVPANPSQTMSVGEDDGLFVFEPVFREARVEKKARKRRVRRAPPAQPPAAPKRPVRVD